MTLKEAKKEAITKVQGRSFIYLTISKQPEVGWYVEANPTQRSVFGVTKDGVLTLRSTDFARNYQRQYLPNVRCKR